MNTPNRDPREQLVAYLDGELSSADRKRVEDYLQRSPEARSELRHHRETWDLLDELPAAKPSDGFRDRFWRNVDSTDRASPTTRSVRGSTSSRGGRWRRIVVPAALAASVLFLAGLLLRFSNSDGDDAGSAPVETTASLTDSAVEADIEPSIDLGSAGGGSLESSQTGDEESGAFASEDERILDNFALYDHMEFLMADGSDLDEHVDFDGMDYNLDELSDG